MPDPNDSQVGAGDGIDFQPSFQGSPSPRPRPAPAPAQARPDDGIDFQPAGASSPQPRATSRPQSDAFDFQPRDTTPKTQPQESISAYAPSSTELLRRTVANSALGSALRMAAPKLFGRILQPTTTVNNPEYEQHRSSLLATSELAPQPGAMRGVNEVIERSTNAPTLLTLAAGPLMSAENLGATGLQTLSRLVSAGFSYQMLDSALRRVPGMIDAVKRGDWPTARQMAAESGTEGLMAVGGGRAASEGLTPEVHTLNQAASNWEPVSAAPQPQRYLRPLLPAGETIAGEPVRTRLAPGPRPLITPEPARTPTGAIQAPASTLSTLRALPPARGPEPDDAADFLAGMPVQMAPIRSLRQIGAVEDYAPGYRPGLTSGESARPLLAPRSAQGEIDFRPISEEAPQSAPRLQAPAEQSTAAPPERTGTATALRPAGPAPPPQADTSAEIQRAANLTFGQLRRDPIEQQYARDVWTAIQSRDRVPEPPPGMRLSRAASIRDRMTRINLGENLPSVLNPDPRAAGQFAPDEIEAAHQRLAEASGMLQQATKPGRYEGVDDEGNGTGNWYGVNSLRSMFPWFADMKESPAELARAIERKSGPTYNRLLQSAAEYEQSSREATRNAMQEVAPDLPQLVEQVRGMDPELAQTLADAGAGKLGIFDGSLDRVKEWAKEHITDARTLAELSRSIDDASEAERAGPARAGGEEASVGAAGAAREEPGGVLPGFGQAVLEQREAAGRATARQLTEQINRPPESIEAAAGEMERRSPLFRGTEASPQREMFKPKGEPEGGTLYSGVDPTRAAAAVRVLNQAWQERVAQPFIDRVLRIGDKYSKAREADPEVAQGLHLLDNAPTYLRQKAAQTIHDVIGGLSRDQERLFTLISDADARENLRANHPDEYRQAMSDPAIQEAVRKYRPIERELTAARQRLGGDTLDQDYLRRVYDKYVAGIGKEQAPGSAERATSAYDRVIRPQRIGSMSREASAEYHYRNGLHEFGPAFATKFIGTNLRSLRNTVAKDFLDKATQLPAGASEPRFILYDGERYYRPDIAADMPRGTKVYDRYDPTAGEKFPQPVDAKFLGPRDVVRALNDYGRREDNEPSGLRRWFQEQVIGFGFGIPHVANILRRVTQNAPGGALNPKGWADAWRVAFNKGLRERGIKGLDDPTFDRLAQQGAISTGEMANLKEYWGGNLNPANWTRALAQVGHKLLYEPGSTGGFGGVDQRARIYLADLVQSQRPDLSDEQVGRYVRDALGDYNRANWSEQQKMLSRFMLFPGWDFSSVRWVLQHPIRTTVPPAILVYLANQTLHKAGANRNEDASDIQNVHVGDRTIGPGVVRESVARNLFRPFINYAQAKVQGANEQRAQASAARGVTEGAGGLLGMLRPDLSGFMALAANRQGLFSSREIVGDQDWNKPGKILPSLALEKQAAFTVRQAIPALDRMLDSSQDLDAKGFVGGNLGLPNYQEGAESRLARNAAESQRVFQAISKVAKQNPAQAREMMRDPDNAAYALFHRDFQSITAAKNRLDETRERIEESNLPGDEKRSRLESLDRGRQTLLGHAEALNNLLFERRQAKPAQPTPLLGGARRLQPLTPAANQ